MVGENVFRQRIISKLRIYFNNEVESGSFSLITPGYLYDLPVSTW